MLLGVPVRTLPVCRRTQHLKNMAVNVNDIVATGQRQTKGYHNRNQHKQTIILSFSNKGGEIHYIQGKQRFQQPSFVKDTESGCCTVR